MASPVGASVPRTGVLFVHGIGESAQSATLREFAAPIVSWLRDWHDHSSRDGSVEIVSSALSYGDQLGTDPAHFELAIHSPEAKYRRQIVFAEAWWATHLDAPSPLEVILWSFRVLQRVSTQLMIAALLRRRAIWKHVAGGGQKPDSISSRIEAAAGILIESTSLTLVAAAYLLGALAGYAVLIPLAILVQIPIPAVQEFILVRLLRPLMVNYIGDFQVYTRDEVQGLSVRAAVERAADWLASSGGCSSIVVVAHSQGAVVAYDAVAAQATFGIAKVTKLITMGGALNRAWQLDPPARLTRPIPTHIRWIDMWTAYDPVPGGKLTPQKTSINHEVTNGMNLLTDHGGYFHNREEVISRIVQEVDVPADHSASRFAFGDQDDRVRRRWRRVMTLVFWRLVAMFLFALVAIRRETVLLSDGRSAWQLLENIPGIAGIREGAGNALTSASGALQALADATAGTPLISKAILVAGLLIDPGTLEPLFKSVLALAMIAGVFGIVYLAVTWLIYDPWVRSDYRAAVAPQLTPRSRASTAFGWARLVAVPASIAALAIGMRTP